VTKTKTSLVTKAALRTSAALKFIFPQKIKNTSPLAEADPTFNHHRFQQEHNNNNNSALVLHITAVERCTSRAKEGATI